MNRSQQQGITKKNWLPGVFPGNRKGCEIMIQKDYYSNDRDDDRIGRSRFVSEITPLIDVMQEGDGYMYPCGVRLDFLRRHKDNLDMFLLQNGFYIETSDRAYEYEQRPYPYFRDDGVVIDYVPMIDYLYDDIADIFNNTSSDDQGVQAYKFTSMLYRGIYDNADLAIIQQEKAKYLCKTISTIMDIDYNDQADKTEIAIQGFNSDAILRNAFGIDAMMHSLGYLISSLRGKNDFMEYLESYINDGRYYQDAFVYGEAILRAFDQYVSPLDWYDHSNAV